MYVDLYGACLMVNVCFDDDYGCMIEQKLNGREGETERSWRSWKRAVVSKPSYIQLAKLPTTLTRRGQN